MTAKYTALAFAAGAALTADDAYENAINLAHSIGDTILNNPSLSVSGAGAVIYGALKAHEMIEHTTPKMYSLASLLHANITNDRRLDQLTESNSINAADQLYNLRHKKSI